MFNGFLIQSYPPQNDVTVAHHITVGINPDFDLSLEPDFTGLTIPKDSEIVTYCQGAYRAANSFLTLKKLGFKNVRVYLGSWGEWGNKLDLPVNG